MDRGVRWVRLAGTYRQRENAKETTPATQADVLKLSQTVTSLASKVGLLGRRRSAEGGGYQQPRQVDRDGGRIIGRPY